MIVSAACDRRAAGEDGKAREARSLVVAEQLVAPVDRRAQRLLAGGRIARAGARARRVRCPGVPRSQRATATRSGRRPARSPAAARRGAGRSRRPRPRCRRRGRSRGRGLARARRTARRRHVGQLRGRRASARAARAAAPGSAARPAGERLAARGEHRHAGHDASSSPMKGAAPSTCSKLSTTSSRCLAARKRSTASSGGLAREHDDPQRRDDRRRDVLGSCDGGERDEVRAVGEVGLDGARGLEREPGLADAARPGQRQQPDGTRSQPLADRTRSRGRDRSCGSEAPQAARGRAVRGPTVTRAGGASIDGIVARIASWRS